MLIDKETIEAVAGLKARYNKPYSSADRELIKELYHTVLGKSLRNTSCQNCYHDAVIELALYIRSQTKKEMATLKAGAIIACPTFHGGKIYTNANITDEVAREYLAAFPKRADLFAVLPPKQKNANGKNANGKNAKKENDNEETAKKQL